MKPLPGTLAEGAAPFRSTQWGLVLRSLESQVDDGAASSREALAQLCEAYWPPLYSFVRRRGYASADAQDLVQGFFAYLLERKAHARADPAKGKFRTFLLAALKHYLADAWDREQTLKRGGGQRLIPLDEELMRVEAAALAATAEGEHLTGGASAEDELFEQRWALAVVGRGMTRLRAGLAAENKVGLLEKLSPFISGAGAPPDQAETAARLGIPPATLRTHIRRLRGRYREALRAEVAHTISSAQPEDVEEELRRLGRVLIAGMERP